MRLCDGERSVGFGADSFAGKCVHRHVRHTIIGSFDGVTVGLWITICRFSGGGVETNSQLEMAP